VCRREPRSASCASTALAEPASTGERQDGVVGCCGIEEASRGGILVVRPALFRLSACCGRSGGRTAVSPGDRLASSGQPKRRACSTSAPGSQAPPRGCCEGRREPSVGDPMKHRRSTRNARAVS
jgi:hypothetical protein